MRLMNKNTMWAPYWKSQFQAWNWNRTKSMLTRKTYFNGHPFPVCRLREEDFLFRLGYQCISCVCISKDPWMCNKGLHVNAVSRTQQSITHTATIVVQPVNTDVSESSVYEAHKCRLSSFQRLQWMTFCHWCYMGKVLQSGENDQAFSVCLKAMVISWWLDEWEKYKITTTVYRMNIRHTTIVLQIQTPSVRWLNFMGIQLRLSVLKYRKALLP